MGIVMTCNLSFPSEQQSEVIRWAKQSYIYSFWIKNYIRLTAILLCEVVDQTSSILTVYTESRNCISPPVVLVWANAIVRLGYGFAWVPSYV